MMIHCDDQLIGLRPIDSTFIRGNAEIASLRAYFAVWSSSTP